MRRAKSGGSYLTAEFTAVHPSEAGFHAPTLPLDAYQDTPCKLKVGGSQSSEFGLSCNALLGMPPHAQQK